MEIGSWVGQIEGFNTLPVSDKIVVLGYYLNVDQGTERFKGSHIDACFNALHLKKPANANSQMTAMCGGYTPRLLKDSKGFRLNSASRAKVAAMLPAIQTPKQITVELKKLEALITNQAQKIFLEETNICFSHGAYRASIVMAWNLAYHHICTYIFDHHLADYNARLPVQFKNEKPIAVFSDFEKTKEHIVIDVAKGASIINKTTHKTLEAKLDIRNTAAHPSSASIQPITAEEVITDLVHNVLLKSPL